MKKQNQYQQTAAFFHILSHPGRLQILDELRRGEACVCHFQSVLKRPQVYVSQQLRVLREAGVVADRRDGTMIYYRLSDPRIESLLNETLGPAGERTPIVDCSCPCCRAAVEPGPVSGLETSAGGSRECCE